MTSTRIMVVLIAFYVALFVVELLEKKFIRSLYWIGSIVILLSLFPADEYSNLIRKIREWFSTLSG